METMQELIPFAKEMLSQKPKGKMVKIYLLGSVLAFFGVVIGLVETVCSPFSSSEEEDISHLEKQRSKRRLEIDEMTKPEEELHVLGKGKQAEVTVQRSTANRLHAS
ncbi:G0/G1 switch protein 2 [Polypterus senegalus]